jgi:hypothetical protein
MAIGARADISPDWIPAVSAPRRAETEKPGAAIPRPSSPPDRKLCSEIGAAGPDPDHADYAEDQVGGLHHRYERRVILKFASRPAPCRPLPFDFF